MLAFAGDAKEAAEIGERAFRVSPPEPYTALWIWYAAIAAIRLEKFETALKHAEAGILIKPDVATGHLLRAIACHGLSRFADGETSIQDAIKSSQSLSLARMPKFMLPRYVDVMDDLPRNQTSMRVLKFELRTRGVTDTTWDRDA